MAGLTDQQKEEVVEGKTPEQIRETAEVALKSLSAEEQKKAFSNSGIPISARTGNVIWLIVVAAFALAMMGSVVTLFAGRFVPIAPKTDDIFTSTETLITLFTTTTAFLGGLLTPSPVRQTGGGQ